jgi:hypothetical protein
MTDVDLWALQPALGRRVENIVGLRRDLLRIVFDDDTTLDITAQGAYGYDAELDAELGTVERER